MEVKIWKKPKNPIIIEGFPGFGLVGTIASEFLLDHLKVEKIGYMRSKDMPPMVAVHYEHIIEPIGIFYNKKHNLVFIHGISGINGIEWQISDAVVKIADDLKAKELISLEGIGSAVASKGGGIFYHTKNDKRSGKLEDVGCKPLKDGIIMGIDGLLMLKDKKKIVSSIFAETHSELPDSKAAARVRNLLGKYIGLKINTKTLLKQDEKREEKLKDILA